MDYFTYNYLNNNKQQEKVKNMQTEKPITKMNLKENIDEFRVKNAQQKPNRYICFIKMKIELQEKENGHAYSVKGSGVTIGRKWVLTAAHTLIKYGQELEKFKQNKYTPLDKSYVKLALHNGEAQGVFKIVSIKICSKYQQSKDKSMHDFALLEIQPLKAEEFVPEESYPPVLAMSKETLQNIKEVSVLGYPIQTNKKASPGEAESSIYIKDMFKGTGGIKNSDNLKLSYKVPTEAGFSGGPVFTKYGTEDVVIAIHKASNFGKKSVSQQNYEGIGVNAWQMLQELNQWGFEAQLRPFVFTERTLDLRKKEEKMKQMEILYLADKNLQWPDMLVVTNYDLSNLKKVMLSGNNLGEEGVALLTRRPLHNLLYLSLAQNKIRSLESKGNADVPAVQWGNIPSITTLILSVNLISSFPSGLHLLQKMENLYFSYNQLPEISQSLIEYCQQLKRRVVIFLYDNRFKEQLPPNREKKMAIQQTNAHVIWTRQQNLNHQKLP